MPDTNPWKRIKKEDCPHIEDLHEDITSEKDACEACGYNEDLRICLTCGAVHCCESHNSHNTEHFQKTQHPFIKPHKSDYDFLWCYKCSAFLD